MTPDDRRHARFATTWIQTRYVFQRSPGCHWCVDQPQGRVLPRSEWTAAERVHAVVLQGRDLLFDFIEDEWRRDDMYEQALIEAVLGVDGRMTEFDITYHIEVSEETMDALLWDTLPGTDYWREGEFFDVEESASDNLIGFKIQLRDDLVEDSDPTPPVFRIDGDVWVRGMLAARAAGVGFADGEPSNDPEEWDFDAWDHDVIIQYALFGERRYAFGVRRHRRVRDARRHHAVQAL